jgi:hypothetical protein
MIPLASYHACLPPHRDAAIPDVGKNDLVSEFHRPIYEVIGIVG